jgi:DNA polymerase (family 10)
MEKNVQIAQLLRQIAALLDEQNVAFKPAAYRKAAQNIEEYSGDVCSLETIKELRAIPGVGEAIAEKIREFCTTGRIPYLEKMMAEQGGLSWDLMQIEGLGPKRVRLLQKELNVKTVDDLVKAAKAGKLNGLPGFSETMEKKILENAGRVEERIRRFTIAEVTEDVERILTAIRKVKGVERCEPAGSYRRRKATVGDVDIAVVTKDPKSVSEAVGKLPIVRNIVAQGDTKISFDVVLRSKEALRVDVRFVTKDQWGSALLYFTGDKEHNIALRKIAIHNGWKLNEYGLFAGEKVIASKEEEDIYAKLGLEWIEPKERTGTLPKVSA